MQCGLLPIKRTVNYKNDGFTMALPVLMRTISWQIKPLQIQRLIHG